MLTLYVVPASHPCVAVMKALELKGLEYKRVDMMFGVSAPLQYLRFGLRTVPGLTIGRQKVCGSRAIMRALDGLQPEPSLVPADPELLAKVNAADEWGDLVMQEHVRWIALTAVGAAPEEFPTFMEGYDVPALPSWSLKAAPYLTRVEGRLLGHTSDRIRDEYLPALPALIDRVDELIAEGVIGGVPNVADLQILSSVRLLLNLGDLAPDIADRPCGVRARELFPDYPGRAPAGAIANPFERSYAS
jgi:glutathione S-transferase